MGVLIVKLVLYLQKVRFDQSSIRLKGEAVVASLEGEYKGDIGKIKGSAKTF